ncbi:MAG: bifunctional metallophosphatase/5'-nucleotidase [Lachnospiraceae bacterium]|nr:bifunctional metallophosphatase/5'-nucleotidase [Lachnospiraceae bacterium]
MKKTVISIAAFCLTVMLSFPLYAVSVSAAEPGPEQVDILFLHDTHSHLDSFPTVEEGQNVTLGGFARIKTLIDEKKEENPDALVLDAGDFSMGTLVQTIFHTDAPELRMLGALGCDASTLGNHEFDYRSAGLAGALDAALRSGDPVPALALCNVDWEAMEAEGLTEDQRLLKASFTSYGIKDYVILDKSGIRIAVLGVFGEDSLACAPTCVLKFRDISEAAADTVKKIRENEDVDMIVCLSHSGTSEEADKSEDEILAKAVPEIDLIVSGHTHTSLYEPIRHGDTYIVSCGSYARNLGSLSMSRQENGRWQMDSYELIPITQDIRPDQATQVKIDSLMEKVDASYLSWFGYTADQVLAQNDIKFATSDDLYYLHEELNLGNLLSDAFVYAAENADDPDDHPIDAAIVPSGCVRDTFATGDVTVTDVFNAYSLGVGPDGIPGYPLISMYLTGAELKTGAEIDASVSDFMKSARLYISGLHFTYNPHRILLNKVTDCYMTDENGERAEIQDDKLYRVVCDLYSGQMLGAVTDVSYGILSVQPKFADGTPIRNIEDAIITDGGRELKAWAAIAGFLDALEDTNGDGVSDIPQAYASAQGRKVVEDSRAIGDLLKNPNKFTFIILGVLLLLLALVILLFWLLIRLVRRLAHKAGARKR